MTAFNIDSAIFAGSAIAAAFTDHEHVSVAMLGGSLFTSALMQTRAVKAAPPPPVVGAVAGLPIRQTPPAILRSSASIPKRTTGV